MSGSHPPVAAGVVAIDFDQTLWEWGDLGCLFTRPTPGAVEAVRALRAAGFTIVIFTSRLSPTWWRDEASRHDMTTEKFGHWQEQVVRVALKTHGIECDRITAEKVPAIAYIDDKAIEFTGDWDAILARLIPAEAAA